MCALHSGIATLICLTALIGFSLAANAQVAQRLPNLVVEAHTPGPIASRPTERPPRVGIRSVARHRS